VTPDPDPTHPAAPPFDNAPNTRSLDPALDAGLAAAFGPDLTPGGWSRPPLLRDDTPDPDPVVQPASPEMPRRTTDRYQLIGEIARGGMGVVLKGRDPDLGRDLALKVLRGDLIGKPAAEQRFVEEAQVGGQLQHPGVVPVYDLGRFADGRPYFAMKLVKGRTLAALLAGRPDPGHDRGRFLHVFLKVCQTVAYAHQRGVIHRDLKPANVMVGNFGEVLVMDWGLAKVLPRGGVADEARPPARRAQPPDPADDPTVIRTPRSGSGSETAAGSVMGTPAFMSPEQAGGETDKLDERADVFGLGSILCVILTGHPPYVGETGETVRFLAVRGKLDAAFGRLDGCGADPELVGLCKRCLARDPADRPANGKAVADAVEAHLAGVESRLRRAEVEQAAAAARAAEERKRRRVQAALGLSFTFLLLLLGAGLWWADRQAAAWQAEQDRAEANRRVESLRRQVEESQRAQAERERLARNAEAVGALLGRCEEALRADDAAKAAVVLEAAERRAAEGGADHLKGRLGRCRADLDLLRELDRTDTLYWTVTRGRFQPPEAVDRWAAVFRRAGVVPADTRPDEAARVINDSLVRDRLLAAADHWLAKGGPGGLADLLRAADPDPFRDAARAATRDRDFARLAELVGRPEAARQPVRFAVVLAQFQGVSAARRQELLRAALRERPADLWVLMALGQGDWRGRGPDEAIRWYQAAVAARPTNVAARINLGAALQARKDFPEAVASLQEAIRLDPTVATAHYNLGGALQAQGDPDGAVAAYREATRFDPNYAEAHNNLGAVLYKQGDRDGAIRCFRAAVRADQNYAVAHLNLAAVLSEEGDLNGAAAGYREALRIEPKNAQARARLAAVEARLRDEAARLPNKAERDTHLAPPPREVKR
jgi:tetratricopeptide (TPR) repeat protein